MGKLAEAYVDIGANTKPLDAGLGRAKAALSSFAGVAGKLAGGLAIGGLAGAGAGLLAAAKKASDLGESLSKVETTFGSAAKSIIGNTDLLAKKFGVVRQESLDAAAAFGLMGQAAGLTKEKSAGLATEMVQLGLDIASFHNLSNAEAFEKLRSGLAGESEPLRPLGILLSDDAMKAQALAMGLIKVRRELTEQEKVIARVALIKKQAGPAVGDLERTKDSTANQMKKLEGELENAAVAFGEGLQDALSDAIKLAHELGEAIRKATGKDVATNVGELTQGGVNASRTALADPNAFAKEAVGRALIDQVDLVVAPLAKLFGADNPLNPMKEAMQRRMEKRAADATGMPLEVKAEKAQQDAQQARMDAARKNLPKLDIASPLERGLRGMGLFNAVDQERDRKAAAARARQDLKAGGRGLLTHFGGQLGNLAGGFQAGEGGAVGAINRFRQGLIPGLGLGRAGGGLLAGAAMMGHRVIAQAGRNIEKGPFQSEQFGGQSEFASSAIQKALSSDDVREKQLRQLEEANAKLDDLKQKGADILGAFAKNPVIGAILRGRS